MFTHQYGDEHLGFEAHKVSIRLFFENGAIDFVDLNKDVEISANDDMCYGIFFSYGNIPDVKKISLAELIDKANTELDDILAEAEQEALDEIEMARELSSVEATGRY